MKLIGDKPLTSAERSRRYDKKNPDKRVESRKRYRENHLERAREQARNNYRNNKDAYKNRNLLRKFGITLEDYNKMFSAQNGCCAICGRHESEIGHRKSLAVDHDHNTGKVRALLCHDCNVGLGFYEKQAKDYEEYLNKFVG